MFRSLDISHSPQAAATASAAAAVKFPTRPDGTVLSEKIPLFYIGRNEHGLWVAREAEGRSGGLFLLRSSAVRFARRMSAPAGCAMMLLDAPLALDVANQGGRLAEELNAAMGVVTRRAPTLAACIGMLAAYGRRLIAHVSRATMGERRNRRAAERELFHGSYCLSSKDDDDLPVIG